jgi:hypothetical protein
MARKQQPRTPASRKTEQATQDQQKILKEMQKLAEAAKQKNSRGGGKPK